MSTYFRKVSSHPHIISDAGVFFCCALMGHNSLIQPYRILKVEDAFFIHFNNTKVHSKSQFSPFHKKPPESKNPSSVILTRDSFSGDSWNRTRESTAFEDEDSFGKKEKSEVRHVSLTLLKQKKLLISQKLFVWW